MSLLMLLLFLSELTKCILSMHTNIKQGLGVCVCVHVCVPAYIHVQKV